MKAYSVDLRQKIINVHTEESISQRQLADRFQVSLSTIHRYLKQAQTGQGLEPKAHGGGHPAKLSPEQMETLRTLIAANNDATLVELCEQTVEQTGVSVSRSTMGRLTQVLGLSRKKNAARQ